MFKIQEQRREIETPHYPRHIFGSTAAFLGHGGSELGIASNREVREAGLETMEVVTLGFKALLGLKSKIDRKSVV